MAVYPDAPFSFKNNILSQSFHVVSEWTGEQQTLQDLFIPTQEK